MDTGREILEALSTSVAVYQHDAVQAAMDRPEDVVPRLVAELEQMLRTPEAFCDGEDASHLPLYAVTLVGHHRATEAHRVLVELASLPGELPFDVFGDAVHECLPVALWKTSGGETGRLEELVRKREANEYCREAAIQALGLGVAEGRLEREDVVRILQGQLAEQEDTEAQGVVREGAALALGQLWPGESMDLLRRAHDAELIGLRFVALEDIERWHDQGLEARMADFVRRGRQRLEQSPHDQLSHWACFQDDGFDALADALPSGGVEEQQPSQRRSRSKDKRKRKQARASRKKNRGKRKGGRGR